MRARNIPGDPSPPHRTTPCSAATASPAHVSHAVSLRSDATTARPFAPAARPVVLLLSAVIIPRLSPVPVESTGARSARALQAHTLPLQASPGEFAVTVCCSTCLPPCREHTGDQQMLDVPHANSNPSPAAMSLDSGLGSTSYTSVFQLSLDTPPPPPPPTHSVSTVSSPINMPALLAPASDRAELRTWALSRLHPFVTILALAERYLNNSQVTAMRPIATAGLSALGETLEGERRAGRDASALSRHISAATCRPLELPADVSARDFHKLFTGDNLRWEFIGLVFTWAGLSVSWSPPSPTEPLFAQIAAPGNDWNEFAAIMMDCSNACISFCQESGPANDLLIWLLYENLVLLTLIHGDSSMQT